MYKVDLKSMRMKRLMTQKQLAAAAGVTQQLISKIETIPDYDPGVLTLTKIATALRCTVDDLVVSKEQAIS